MEIMTQEEIKNFKPSVEMIKTAQEVFLNMANVETIKPIVEKIQKEVLNKHKFKIAKKYHNQERDLIVLNNDRTYLLNDKDFKVYLKECRQEEIKIKLIDESFNKDFCPLLVAEHNLIKAQHKLINLMGKPFKIKSENIYKTEHRKKFIDLSLKYLVQFI